MHHFTAYIDEAGDEGFGKLAAGPVGGQSRWLALGACLVTRETDLALPSLRDKILGRFPNKASRDLHFRDLKHDQKTVVCQEMAQMPLGICVTLSHKVTLPGSSYEAVFKKKGYLYNYLVRWLLERITWVLWIENKPEPCSLKLVFSRRGGTDYHSMKSYLAMIRDKREMKQPIRRIVWEMLDIDQIAVENHNKWAGLQLADCATSAFFTAVEPNQFGNFEPSYATILKPKLLSQNGVYLNNGITAVPSVPQSRCNELQAKFFAAMRD